eukprot:scaffold1235_cov300-Pavlova_lutheri.AAC.5
MHGDEGRPDPTVQWCEKREPPVTGKAIVRCHSTAVRRPGAKSVPSLHESQALVRAVYAYSAMDTSRHPRDSKPPPDETVENRDTPHRYSLFSIHRTGTKTTPENRNVPHFPSPGADAPLFRGVYVGGKGCN